MLPEQEHKPASGPTIRGEDIPERPQRIPLRRPVRDREHNFRAEKWPANAVSSAGGSLGRCDWGRCGTRRSPGRRAAVTRLSVVKAQHFLPGRSARVQICPSSTEPVSFCEIYDIPCLC